MKKVLFNLMFTAILLGLNSCSDNSSADNSSVQLSNSSEMKNPNPIEGAWYLVKGEYFGNTREDGTPFQIKLFSEKHFALIMDSNADGKGWEGAHAGTYTLEGNVYSETFKFSVDTITPGMIIDWKYEIKGDTLLMEGPLKAMKDGVENPDLVGGYNTMKEIRIRAN